MPYVASCLGTSCIQQQHLASKSCCFLQLSEVPALLDDDSPWRELGPYVGNDTSALSQPGSPVHAADVNAVHNSEQVGLDLSTHRGHLQRHVSAWHAPRSAVAAWLVCHLQQATQYSPILSQAAADKLPCPVVVQPQPVQPFTAVGDEREMAAGSPVAADASGKHRWSQHSSGSSPNRRVADGPYDDHVAALRWVPAVSAHAHFPGCQGCTHLHVYLQVVCM